MSTGSERDIGEYVTAQGTDENACIIECGFINDGLGSSQVHCGSPLLSTDADSVTDACSHKIMHRQSGASDFQLSSGAVEGLP